MFRRRNSRFQTYSLGERTALADGDPVTLLNTESGGDVSSQVLVALLVTVVLGDVVEVFTADDDGAVHLGGHNTAGQDTATDGDETGEGALLVCTVQSVSWLIISKGYGDSGKIFRIADSFLEGGGCGIH